MEIVRDSYIIPGNVESIYDTDPKYRYFYDSEGNFDDGYKTYIQARCNGQNITDIPD